MEVTTAVEDETSTSSVSPGAEDKSGAMLKNPDDLTQFVISGKQFEFYSRAWSDSPFLLANPWYENVIPNFTVLTWNFI